jgi:hypothetical protein
MSLTQNPAKEWARDLARRIAERLPAQPCHWSAVVDYRGQQVVPGMNTQPLLDVFEALADSGIEIVRMKEGFGFRHAEAGSTAQRFTVAIPDTTPDDMKMPFVFNFPARIPARDEITRIYQMTIEIPPLETSVQFSQESCLIHFPMQTLPYKIAWFKLNLWLRLSPEVKSE